MAVRVLLFALLVALASAEDFYCGKQTCYEGVASVWVMLIVLGVCFKEMHQRFGIRCLFPLLKKQIKNILMNLLVAQLAVMGLDRSAGAAEIRKAYRALSLQLHPDRNKARVGI